MSSLCFRLALCPSIHFLHVSLTCIEKFSWNLKFDVGFLNEFLLEKYYIKMAFYNVHDGRIMHSLRCSGIFILCKAALRGLMYWIEFYTLFWTRSLIFTVFWNFYWKLFYSIWYVFGLVCEAVEGLLIVRYLRWYPGVKSPRADVSLVANISTFLFNYLFTVP